MDFKVNNNMDRKGKGIKTNMKQESWDKGKFDHKTNNKLVDIHKLHIILKLVILFIFLYVQNDNVSKNTIQIIN